MTDQTSNTSALSRRRFLTATSTAAIPLLAGPAGTEAQAQTKPADPAAAIPVDLSVNGKAYRLSIDARTTLLDALREHIGLTGSKKGCDQGQCGACTLLVDGKRVLGCLTLAVQVPGKEVTTIEGLARADGTLHPMQAAFVENDAFQCGYCTPGQIMSAIGCVREGHASDRAAIRESMSGNLCRCGAYANIVDAIEQAREATRS